MSNTKRLILILDDDAQIRSLLVRIISGANIHGVLAATVKEANLALRSNHFDALVTDVDLPDGDGIDFVRAARAQVQHLPAVIISGHFDPYALPEFAKTCPTIALAKPFFAADLLAALTAVLDMPCTCNALTP